MGPLLCRGRGGKAGARAGFTLLALLLVLAALTLLTAMALQLGEDERRSASLVRHDARALAIAEVGLERTRAYLNAVLASQVDLDRALDPNLDTSCAGLPTLGGTRTDDHLPVFTDGAAVVMPGSGKRFLRVPSADGAYLVRIDDNDDDAETSGLVSSTSNNPGSGCTEGPVAGVARNNPVRDRDQTVLLTVVGLFPGMDVASAQARKVLRVRVGPQPASGVIAGGSISMGGSSHVCGLHGNISAGGDITGTGCLCGTGCKGGPSYQDCKSSNTCLAQSEGSTCNITSGGSPSTCVPGASVPPPPRINVWSSTLAPPGCNGATCTPFYYLRDNGGTAQVYMWNYSLAGCGQPQSCPRLSHPGEAPTGPCSACWKRVYDAAADCSGGVAAGEVRMVDEPSLWAASPSRTTACSKSTPLLWKESGFGYVANVGCDSGSGTWPGPDTSRWSQHAAFSGSFQHAGTLLPRGIWLVEGNVHFTSDMPTCAAHPAGWSATVLAQGDVVNEAQLALRPAHPRGIVLLSGRDTDFKTGNTTLYTCDTSAAVLVHEQFTMGSNAHLEAQLVVEDAGSCSTTATAPAISLLGNATIDVPQLPPISPGTSASVLDWSESSY